MKIRGFEIAKGFEDKGINLPQRSTTNSAGYDFECAETIIIEPISAVAKIINPKLGHEMPLDTVMYRRPTLIKTGIKSYMAQDEVLSIYNRSSNPFKKGLVMANSVGIIDSDYYGNPDNDGHIMFAFYNFGHQPITIEKGDKIGQGIFTKFLKVDSDDSFIYTDRSGGFGSTDQ